MTIWVQLTVAVVTIEVWVYEEFHPAMADGLGG